MAKFEGSLIADGVKNGKESRYLQIPTAAGRESDDRLEYWRSLGQRQADALGVECTYLPIYSREDAFNQKYFVEKEEYEAMAESSKKVSDTTLSIATIPKSKLLLNYILQDNLKDLAETRIFSTDDSTDIRIQYLSREIVSGFNLPNKVLISLSKSKYNLVVKLEYDKTTVNEKIEIIFLIPEKYEVCN